MTRLQKQCIVLMSVWAGILGAMIDHFCSVGGDTAFYVLVVLSMSCSCIQSFILYK